MRLRIRLLTTLAAMVSTVQAKPAFVAMVGGVTGAATWWVVWADQLKLAFALAAAFFGFLGAAIAVLLVVPRVIRFLRAWRAYGLSQADRDPPSPPAPPVPPAPSA